MQKSRGKGRPQSFYRGNKGGGGGRARHKGKRKRKGVLASSLRLPQKNDCEKEGGKTKKKIRASVPQEQKEGKGKRTVLKWWGAPDLTLY